MTREQKYTDRLKAMGVYDEAFDAEIHMLAIMERDNQRTVKAWRERGSSVLDDLYPVIERQRRDILAHRDALGLTPKALRRMRPAPASPLEDAAEPSPVASALLASLRSQAAANAGAVSDPDTHA